MATAFTAITDGVDWQAVTFVNEMVDAYSERRQAAGYASMASIAAGADIQAASFWNTMQNGIDASVTAGKWVDPDTSPFTGDAAIPVYTLATFRADAGMDTDGWRRATAWVPGAVDGTWQNDVTFYYGPMQAGDIIGPWIFDDLHKAISEMKWTVRNDYTVVDSEYWWPAVVHADADCDTARTAHIDDWDVQSWQTTANIIYEAYLVTRSTSNSFDAGRFRGKSYMASIYTGVDHSCDLYYMPTNDTLAGATTFIDVDSLVWADDQLALYQTFASSAVATRTSTLLSPSYVSPVEIVTTCPISGGVVIQGLGVGNAFWVFKWTFTTSN